MDTKRHPTLFPPKILMSLKKWRDVATLHPVEIRS